MVQIPLRKFIIAGPGGFEVCPSDVWDPMILEILIAPTGLVLFLFGILIIIITKLFSRKDVKRRFSS
ncbi:MAG: hypothetical protein CM15mP62_00640 [Rhodospirillaceae bacterium]|nr:MAG: hypothetical protein CM15mP62_00640 [Rhodospirillaceae bacterium]